MNEFYLNGISTALRFGDILHGYIIVDLIVKKPIVPFQEKLLDYNVKITLPKHCVILTPCCSIEKSVFSICPLEQIKSSFFKNDYFKEDLTRINRRMTVKQSLTSEEWDKLDEEQQANSLISDPQFALLQYFIYPPNTIFEPYTIKGQDTQYHMIDFKNAIRIKCDSVNDTKKVDAEILSSKLLELSVSTRYELREKISNFYSRVPEEDLVEQH